MPFRVLLKCDSCLKTVRVRPSSFQPAGGDVGNACRGRPVAAAGLLLLIPVALMKSALTSLAFVTGVCVLLVLYEAVRHRETRAFTHSRRGVYKMEEAAEIERRRTSGGAR